MKFSKLLVFNLEIQHALGNSLTSLVVLTIAHLLLVMFMVLRLTSDKKGFAIPVFILGIGIFVWIYKFILPLTKYNTLIPNFTTLVFMDVIFILTCLVLMATKAVKRKSKR